MDKYPQLPPESAAAELFGGRVRNSPFSSPFRVGDLLVSGYQILVATDVGLGCGFYLRDGCWEWYSSFRGLDARPGDRVFR